MKKLIAAIAVIAAGGLSSALADDENVLFWMVGEPENEASHYSYAQLYYADANGARNTVDAGGWYYVPKMDVAARASLSGFDSSLLTSFFVEYYNGQNEMVGTSDPWTWSALVSAGYVSSTQSNPPVVATGVWTPNFNVPEPTSGLLVLLGLAGLALRRRTMKAAA